MAEEDRIEPKTEQPHVKVKRTASAKPSLKKTEARKLTRNAAEKVIGAKGLPWTFPKHTLEDAIRVARAVEDKNAGNPMPALDVAIAVGYRQSQDWRFLELLRSANQYGLVDGTGPAAKITLAKLGQDIVAPSSPQQRLDGLSAAFRHVKDFQDVERFYGGKSIPEDEFFLNTLNREFGIPRDRAETFAKVFTTNLAYLAPFSLSSSVRPERGADLQDLPFNQGTPPEKIPSPAVIKEPRGREF